MNVNFSTLKGSLKSSKLFYRISFHIWNFCTIIQVVNWISIIVTLRRIDGSFKLFINLFFKRACILTSIISLYMNRNKFKKVLIEINKLKCQNNLSRNQIKYITLFTVLYIHILFTSFMALLIIFFDSWRNGWTK